MYKKKGYNFTLADDINRQETRQKNNYNPVQNVIIGKRAILENAHKVMKTKAYFWCNKVKRAMIRAALFSRKITSYK